MALETLRPTGELSDAGLVTNSELDHDEDPDSVSATVAATADGVNTEWGGTFATPTGNPTVGADKQEFRVGVEEHDIGQTGTPTARIELWENGTLVRAGSENDMTTYEVLSFTWNANELATADGSLVECKLIGTKAGGSPTTKSSVAIGHMEWNVDYTAGGGSATFKQEKFRARTDGASEGEAASNWIAAENTAWNQLPDVNFRLRFLIQETAGSGATESFQLQYRQNGGTWTDVNASSSVVRSFASDNLTDGGDTTEQMAGSGSFITDNNGIDEVDGLAGATVYVGSDDAEYEYVVQVRSADTKYGDKIEMRLIDGSDVVLDTYTNIALLWRDSASVTLRQVDAFSISMGSGATSVTYNTGAGMTTLLDLDKAFLVYGFRVNTGTPPVHSVEGIITSTTSVVFTRATSGAAMEIYGYVCEFTDGVRVTRGTILEAEIDGGTGGTFTEEVLNIFDIDKSFVLSNILSDGGGSIYDSDDIFVASIAVNGNTVEVTVETSDTATSNHDVNYEVVQYQGCAVQRGSITMTTGETTKTAVLSPAVDVGKSLINSSFKLNQATSDLGRARFRVRHTINSVSGDEITADRDHSASLALDDLRWEVVEFTNDVTVQEVLETFVGTDAQEDATITAVSGLDKAMVLASVCMNQGQSTLSTDDIAGDSTFTAELTTVTNLQTKRTATNDDSDVAFYVVDFGASSAGPFTSTGAPNFEIFELAAVGVAGEVGTGAPELAIQELAADAVQKMLGTGAPELAIQELAAVGVAGEVGTGAPELEIQELATVGVQKMLGTGAPELAIQELATVGVQKHLGTGAPNLEIQELAAVGVAGEVGTGAPNLEIQELATVGVQKMLGTGLLDLAIQELAAVGLMLADGTGAPELAIQELATVGTSIADAADGTGAPELAIQELATVGVQKMLSTGAPELAIQELTAVGVAGEVGTGAPELEIQELATVGVQKMLGTGALNLEIQELAAVALMEATGTGAPDLAIQELATAGLHTPSAFEGTGALDLASFVLDAIGIMPAVGTGAPEFSIQELATVGKAFLPGVATLLLAQAPPGSATETQRPDGELSDVGLVANSELDHDEDPDSVSATVAATADNVSTEWGGDFPTPTGNPRVGAGLQEFRVGIEEFATGRTNTPTARIELWENGTLVRAGSENNVGTYAVHSFTWNANELATADGSLVQCKVFGTKAGGGPTARNAVNLGHMEWNVDYAVGGGQEDIFVTATGKQVMVSTGAPELSPQELVAVGAAEHIGTGAPELQPEVLAAVGLQAEPTGVGALELASEELVAVGEADFVGTAGPNLADFSLVAIGLGSTVLGPGAPELENFTIVTVGELKPVGVGDVAFAPLVLTADGLTDAVAAVGVYRPIMRPRRR